jgi:molecular chaperone DnaK
VFGKVYQQANAQANSANMGGNAGGAAGGAGEQKPKDDVVDAEYEVVDDDKKQ